MNHQAQLFSSEIFADYKNDNMDQPGRKFEEKTLMEIGFNGIEIPNWNDIVQPDKADLLEELKNMITTFDKTNVKIKIDDIIFNCHMMVLQCYSDFFADKTLEQVVILPSDKVTPQAFIMVYDWMLSTKPVVQREGILELFNAAQFLRIKDLVNQCWVCLDDEEKFTEDAAFLLYLESRNNGHILMKQLMLTRVCKFFLTLVASKEFLELTLEEVCTLFESNTIGVNAESEVLMAAVRWLDFDWENREKHVYDVIKCVRFGLMAPWQLVELSRKSDSPEVQRVVDHPEVRKMIDDGLSYVTTKYWHASNTDNFVQLMKQLNLKEPIGRQFVYDKTWIEKFVCPYQNYNSYNTFLKYLEMIRSMGREHWKTLTYHEGNPNKLLKGTTQDTLFLHYFSKIIIPAPSKQNELNSRTTVESSSLELKHSSTSTSDLSKKISKRVGTTDVAANKPPIRKNYRNAQEVLVNSQDEFNSRTAVESQSLELKHSSATTSSLSKKNLSKKIGTTDLTAKQMPIRKIDRDSQNLNSRIAVQSQPVELKQSSTTTPNLSKQISNRVDTTDDVTTKKSPIRKIYRASLSATDSLGACDSFKEMKQDIGRDQPPDELDKFSKYFEEINYDVQKNKKIYKFSRIDTENDDKPKVTEVNKSDVCLQTDSICNCYGD